MAVEHWNYHTEGNNNMIFINSNNRTVLRLPKLKNEDEQDQEKKKCNLKTSVSDEVEFLEQVIYKILNDIQINFKGEKLGMTPDFIRKLFSGISDRRPICYRGEKLDESVKYGLLLPNFCNLMPLVESGSFSLHNSEENNSDYPTVSVELRPKYRYFTQFGNEPRQELKQKCFFCLIKLYNKIRFPTVKHTSYCPCDLYSQKPVRIKQALCDLITCPQRYLSVRQNGKVIYSSSILAQVAKETLNSDSEEFNNRIFNQVVSPLFNDKCNNGKEAFVNIVRHCLQASVINIHNPTAQSRLNQHCSRKQSSDVNELPNKSQREFSKNQPQYRNVLSLLDSLHSMRDLPVHQVNELYLKINKHLEDHPEDAEVLSLGPPYDVEPWKSVTTILHQKNKCKPETCGSVNNNKNKPGTLQLNDAAETLRRFIIGRGIGCCSLIISLKRFDKQSKNPLPSVSNKQDNTYSMLVPDEFGNRYVACISLLDLYKHPPNQIEKYCRRETEVISFLNDYFSKN